MMNDTGKAYVNYSRQRLVQEYLSKITKCLAELSEEDVWWRAHETDNSIGNLMLHLNGNVRQWIVSGIGGVTDSRERKAEFSERDHLPKSQLLATLEATLREADEALSHLDSSRLLEVCHIQNFDVTYLDAISHVVEHFSMHLGQIIYITKLRKSIDLRFYDL